MSQGTTATLRRALHQGMVDGNAGHTLEGSRVQRKLGKVAPLRALRMAHAGFNGRENIRGM